MRWGSGLALGVAAILATVGAGQAFCPICNATVVLDDKLAACFVERADGELAEMQRAGDPVRLIDLADCRDRGELPLGPGQTSVDVIPLDTEFMIDQKSLVCLRDAIKNAGTPLDTPHSFDLTTMCK